MDIQNPADYWENRLKKNYGLDGTGFIGLGISYNRWMYKIRRQVVIREVRSLDVDCIMLVYLMWDLALGFI